MAKNKNKELPDDAFSPENVKVRISIFLDGDVLVKAKERAKAEGSKYQTYINQLLRQVLIDENSEQSMLLYLKGLAILKDQVEKHKKDTKRKKGA